MSQVAECSKWMEQISASLDGELSPEEEEALEEHLAECQDCRTAMALLRSMAQVMREDTVQPPEQLAEGTRFLFEREKEGKGFSLRRWRFTAIAAVLCLALFGVVKLVPWSGGNKSADTPMAVRSMEAQADVKSPAGAPAQEEKYMCALSGAAAATKEPLVQTTGEDAEAVSGEEPDAMADAAPKEGDYRGFPGKAAGTDEAKEDGAEGFGAIPGAASDAGDSMMQSNSLHSAESLPGYAIYSRLEAADAYYSVCFVYGKVPETIRTNRECTPLDAPEGQERWLVPHSVCVNEGLLEQFSEVYYGDLLAQQGLVIGILDMEEDQWQP